MKNCLRLTVEIDFSDDNAPLTEEDQKLIAERVLNALVNQVDMGGGLAPDEAPYHTEHIYVNDYMTGGREYKFIHSF